MSDPTQLLTWAALLAKWTDFARSAVALPREGEGGRLRQAVPAIIALQSVTFALGESDALPSDERTLGLDRAEVLIRRHAAELHQIWSDDPLDPEVAAVIHDARTALAAARDGGLEWTVASERMTAEHPDPLVESLVSRGFDGDLFVPVPGAELFKTCPAVFARGRSGSTPAPSIRDEIDEFYPDLTEPRRVPGPRQVYRQLDFATGKVSRDLVVPMDVTLPGGQPQLVCALRGGEPNSVPISPRTTAYHIPIPVVFHSPT